MINIKWHFQCTLWCSITF